jgi:DNA-directed RNA polymerase specialized sigma24 family protein
MATRQGGGDEEGFDVLIRAVEPRLARAFAAAYGRGRGEEALGEALAYAWEHRAEVLAMANPGGFLYRVDQSRIGAPLWRRRGSHLDRPGDRGRLDCRRRQVLSARLTYGAPLTPAPVPSPPLGIGQQLPDEADASGISSSLMANEPGVTDARPRRVWGGG